MVTVKDMTASERKAMRSEMKAAFMRLIKRWKGWMPVTGDEWDTPHGELARLIFGKVAAGECGDLPFNDCANFLMQWSAIKEDIRDKHIDAVSRDREMEAMLKEAFVKLLGQWNGAMPLSDYEWRLDRDAMSWALTSRIPAGKKNFDNRDSFLAQWRDISDGIRAKYKEEEDV